MKKLMIISFISLSLVSITTCAQMVLMDTSSSLAKYTPKSDSPECLKVDSKYVPVTTAAIKAVQAVGVTNCKSIKAQTEVMRLYGKDFKYLSSTTIGKSQYQNLLKEYIQLSLKK